MTHPIGPGRKPLVYIAGPYSAGDQVLNVRSAFAEADLISGFCTPIVPHASMLWHLIAPKPYEEWLAYDLEVLAHCHAVLRLPGESKGADGEVAFAEEHGIPVFTSREGLIAWVPYWIRGQHYDPKALR